MSNGMWGMDTAEVRDHAAKMDGGVSAVHGAMGRVEAALSSTEWFGRYADEFVQEWHGAFKQQLNGVTNALTDNATVLRRRADMQDEASSS
ncbi:hypothetical protein [Jatrophihabitans fulvus]